MKSISVPFLIFMLISYHSLPVDAICTAQLNHSNHSNIDKISVRIGTVRRLRGKDEFGVPKGRWLASVRHISGNDKETYRGEFDGEVKSKIDFKKNDQLHFKSNWIKKPLVITNEFDHNESSNRLKLVSIGAALIKDTTAKIVDGTVQVLSENYKHTDVIIYADSMKIGSPDLIGRFAVPVNQDGIVTIEIKLKQNRKDGTIAETTIAKLEVNTGSELRAKVDIVFDDDNKDNKKNKDG